MTRWDGMQQHRRNVKLSSLDAYMLKDHLRGGPLEDEEPGKWWLPWVVIAGYLALLALLVNFAEFIDLF